MNNLFFKFPQQINLAIYLQLNNFMYALLYNKVMQTFVNFLKFLVVVFSGLFSTVEVAAAGRTTRDI